MEKDCIEGEFDDTSPTYQGWLKSARGYREKRFGPLRRQLAHVKNLIPGTMNNAALHGFQLLAAFDCFQPHFPGHAIWILQADDEWALDIESGPVRSSAIDKEGKLYPPYCKRFRPYKDVTPPFWVITYLVPPTKNHEFSMRNGRGKIIGTIKVREVIRDKNLMKQELPNNHDS